MVERICSWKWIWINMIVVVSGKECMEFYSVLARFRWLNFGTMLGVGEAERLKRGWIKLDLNISNWISVLHPLFDFIDGKNAIIRKCCAIFRMSDKADATVNSLNFLAFLMKIPFEFWCFNGDNKWTVFAVWDHLLFEIFHRWQEILFAHRFKYIKVKKRDEMNKYFHLS